ncbi:MAG: DUF47 family protein [Chthoniobacteraceae bacterium]
MISFQRLLGREGEFFGLLEASAQECMHSVAAFQHLLARPGVKPSLEEFASARRRDKEITNKLEEMLIRTFVTPIEREDLEAFAVCLYKIPKTLEKFAERYALSVEKIADVDFARLAVLLDRAVTSVRDLVQALRVADFKRIKLLQRDLQKTEVEADAVLIEGLRMLYQPGFPPLKAVILKDLFALIEKAIDRCRDAGNVASHVLLKNS